MRMTRSVRSRLHVACNPPPINDENESSDARSAALATGGVFVPRVNLMLTMSPGEIDGTRGAGFEAMTDTMPGQHTTAPALLFSLRGHDVQARTDVAFEYAEAVPALQGVQLSSKDALNCTRHPRRGLGSRQQIQDASRYSRGTNMRYKKYPACPHQASDNCNSSQSKRDSHVAVSGNRMQALHCKAGVVESCHRTQRHVRACATHHAIVGTGRARRRDTRLAVIALRAGRLGLLHGPRRTFKTVGASPRACCQRQAFHVAISS